MNANHHLQAAYAEWQRLAETEGEAIRLRDWPLVADCQKALYQLQPEIIRRTQAAQTEWTRLGLDHAVQQEGFRKVIAGLIKIESQNNSLLDGLRRSAKDRLDQLERAGRTLRQVKRSYAPPGTAGWESFS